MLGTSWKPGKTVLGALLVAILPFLQRLLYLGELYYGRDFTEVFGARNFFYGHLRQGRLILWDALQATGIPFPTYLFDLFNPLSLAYAFFLQDGYLRSTPAQWLLAFHCALGALGAYGLGLTLHLGRTAAVVMGVIMGCSGVMTIKSVEPMMVHTFVWAPFVFLFLHRARERGGLLEGMWAGFFFGLCFLGGHPQVFYYVTIAVLVYVLTGLVTDKQEMGFRSTGTRMLRIYVPFAVSFLLATFPQTTHFLANSLWAPEGVMAGAGFRKLLVHSQSGSADLSFLYHFIFPTMEGGHSESYFYVGIFPLLMAWVALLHGGHRSPSRFWIILVVVSLVLMLGGNLGIHKLLVYALPGFKNFRFPSRWSFLVSLGLLVLAGFGVSRLLSSKKPEDFHGMARLLPATIGALLLIIVAALLVRQLEVLPRPQPIQVAINALTGLTILLTASWFVFRKILAGERGPATGTLIVFLVVLDLVFYHPAVGINLNMVQSERDFGPDPAEVTAPMEKMAEEIAGSFEGQASRILVGVQGIRTPWERNISQSAFYRHRVRSFFPIDGYPERLHPLGYWQMVWESNLMQMPRAINLLGAELLESKRSETAAQRSRWDLRGCSQGAVRLTPAEKVVNLSLEGGVDGVGGTPETVVARIGLVEGTRLKVDWPITRGQLATGGPMEIPLAEAQTASEILLASTLTQGKVRIEKLLVNGKPVADTLQLAPVNQWLSRNAWVMPPAYFVSRAAVFKDQTPYLEALLSSDPSRCVLFRKTPPGYQKPGGLTAAPGGEVRIIRWADQEVRLQVTAESPGYLVMTQSAFPGWSAWIDGKKTPILKAYGFLTALAVTPGTHTVRFTYREPWVVAGLLIAPLWVLGLLITTVWRRRK